jgi:signal transduction histidine kinase
MSGRHLRSLQESMLEFARLGDAAPTPRLAPVDAAQLAADALALVGEDAQAAGHTLAADVPAELRVLGDADGLRRVLINLLTNAVRYTPSGGRVTVRGARAGAGATLAVEDTGVGIPADLLETVFEPYYRVPGAGSAAPAGAGLGLAIVRELVEQMGGRVRVQSAVGTGSTFTVSLPAV